MPIQSFTSTEANRNVRRNPVSAWPDGRRRGERLEGIAKIAPQPSFTIDASDKIMTIGSCFAREIEKALASRGFDVPATTLALPAEERASQTANDILNKYTVHSMANEIEWAFEAPQIAPEDLFVTAGDGLWHDPHLIANMEPVTLERAIERREQVLEIMRRLPECKVVVITLGLAEAWYDTKLGIYLNVMPPQPALRAEPDRFRLDVLGYDDVTDGIERFLGLLEKYGHPDHRVIMTVSPVPFKASFSGTDALAANTYSKAVQRAAAQAAVVRHERVDYFPSFEIVTLTDRKVAFKIDNIHVNRSVVDEIMRRVAEHYVPGLEVETAQDALDVDMSRDPFTPEAMLGDGFDALAKEDYARAANQFSAILHRHGSKKPGLMRDAQGGLVRALLGARQIKEAIRMGEAWLAQDAGTTGQAEAVMSKVQERAKQPGKALMWARRAVEVRPENGNYLQRVAVLLERQGNLEEARDYAERALAQMPELDLARRIAETPQETVAQD